MRPSISHAAIALSAAAVIGLFPAAAEAADQRSITTWSATELAYLLTYATYDPDPADMRRDIPIATRDNTPATMCLEALSLRVGHYSSARGVQSAAIPELGRPEAAMEALAKSPDDYQRVIRVARLFIENPRAMNSSDDVQTELRLADAVNVANQRIADALWIRSRRVFLAVITAVCRDI